MKSLIKNMSIIAFIVIIEFSFISCGDDGNGGNEGGGGNSGTVYFGQTLNLTGQVWTYNVDNNTWAKYTGNRVVQSEFGGSGAITNGQLNFTVGIPSPLESITSFIGDAYTNFNISNLDAECAVLSYLITEPPGYIGKGWVENEGYLEAYYLYVDRDVTITGKGIKNYVNDGIYSYTTTDINLSFKAGWNVTCQNYNRDNNELIMSASIKNPPNLRWTLDEYYE